MYLREMDSQPEESGKEISRGFWKLIRNWDDADGGWLEDNIIIRAVRKVARLFWNFPRLKKCPRP